MAAAPRRCTLKPRERPNSPRPVGMNDHSFHKATRYDPVASGREVSRWTGSLRASLKIFSRVTAGRSTPRNEDVRGKKKRGFYLTERSANNVSERHLRVSLFHPTSRVQKKSSCLVCRSGREWERERNPDLSSVFLFFSIKCLIG